MGEKSEIRLRKERLLTESIEYLQSMTKCLQRIMDGESEQKVCEENNIARNTLRYFVGGRRMGFQPSEMLSGEELDVCVQSPEQRILERVLKIKGYNDMDRFTLPDDTTETTLYVLDRLREHNEGYYYAVHDYFYDYISFSKIADKLGLTRQCVEQYQKSGLLWMAQKYSRMLLLGKAFCDSLSEELKRKKEEARTNGVAQELAVMYENETIKEYTDRMMEYFSNDSTLIKDLGYTDGIVTALEKHGIYSVGDLARFDGNLIDISGIGITKYNELKRTMRSLGYLL